MSSFSGYGSAFYCLRQDILTCNLTQVGAALPIHNSDSGNTPTTATLGVFVAPYYTREGWDAAEYQVIFGPDGATTSTSTSTTNALTSDFLPGTTTDLNVTLPGTHAFFMEVEGRGRYYSDPYLNKDLHEAFYATYHPSQESTVFTFVDYTVKDKDGKSPLLAEFTCTNIYPLELVEYVIPDGMTLGQYYESLEEANAQNCSFDKVTIDYWKPNIKKVEGISMRQSKQRITAILSAIAATLSVLGSGFLILTIVLRKVRNKYSTTRDRIVLGMSTIDIYNSFCLGLGSLPTPQGSIDVIWASGSTAFCEAQGFGIQLGFGVPVYNCMLCLYFLLVIGFGKDEVTIRKSYEWFLHLAPLGFAFSTAIAGLVMNMYNSNGAFCWIEPYPFTCMWNHWEHLGCTRGANAEDFMWYVAGYPLIFCFVFILASMGTIYYCVSKQVRMIRQRYGSQASGNGADARIRATAWQATMFVSAFFATYFFGFLVSMLRFARLDYPFWLHAVYRFLLPLQGFWNYIIFLRPTYTRLRNRTSGKDKWFFQVWYQVMYLESFGFVPPPPVRRRSVGLPLSSGPLTIVQDFSSKFFRRKSSNDSGIGVRSGNFEGPVSTHERKQTGGTSEPTTS